MAGFIRSSKTEAEQCLRDFPENWERITEKPDLIRYRCKADPEIVAQVSRAGQSWFCEIYNAA